MEKNFIIMGVKYINDKILYKMNYIETLNLIKKELKNNFNFKDDYFVISLINDLIYKKMTPENKAKELINKFTIEVNGGYNIKFKNHALIAVDEIIKEMSFYFDEYDCNDTLDKVEYWINVKNELEKNT